MRSEPALRAWAQAALLVLAAASTRAADDPAAAAAARIFAPPLVVERTVVDLTEEQAASVRAVAGTAPPSRSIVSFVARQPGPGGAPGGYAYLDTHLIRTLEETLLVALDTAGRVLRVEVLEFAEPAEYRPSSRWLAQFDGRELSPGLQLKRGIRTLAGATLSSHAVTDAVRRVQALHGLLHPAAEGKP